MKDILCLTLLVASFLLGANGNILARKSFDPEVLVAQHPNTVTITVFNVGEAPVFDVSVNDSAWGEGWTVKSGELSAKFARIDAGANASFSYVVESSKAISLYFVEPAVVTYFTDQLSGARNVHLSSASTERVFRSTYYSRLFYSTPLDWAIVITLAGLSTLPSFLIWFYYNSNYENGLKKKSSPQASSN
jgi:hypothetical protein